MKREKSPRRRGLFSIPMKTVILFAFGLSACGGVLADDANDGDGGLSDASSGHDATSDSASDASGDISSKLDAPAGDADGGTGVLTTLSSLEDDPTDIVVDSTNVYWINGNRIRQEVRRRRLQRRSDVPRVWPRRVVRHRDRFDERVFHRVRHVRDYLGHELRDWWVWTLTNGGRRTPRSSDQHRVRRQECLLRPILDRRPAGQRPAPR